MNGLRTPFRFRRIRQIENRKRNGIRTLQFFIQLSKDFLLYFEVFLFRKFDVPDRVAEVFRIEAEHAVVAVLYVVAVIAVRTAPALRHLEAALQFLGVKAVDAER
jgi:hypothetical protein